MAHSLLRSVRRSKQQHPGNPHGSLLEQLAGSPTHALQRAPGNPERTQHYRAAEHKKRDHWTSADDLEPVDPEPEYEQTVDFVRDHQQDDAQCANPHTEHHIPEQRTYHAHAEPIDEYPIDGPSDRADHAQHQPLHPESLEQWIAVL